MKPAQIRRSFLERAENTLELMFKIMDNPNEQYTAHQLKTIELVWPTLSKILVVADDPISIAWDSPDTAQRIDSILDKVVSGELSTEQAKNLLALYNIGFDMSELPKLLEALEKAENETN